MPSKQVYELLSSRGLKVDNSRFNKYDTIESSADLDLLFTSLRSVRDANNRPAIMTPVLNVANPDFLKIKEADFSRYFYEPFTVTLERYYPSDRVFRTWLEGTADGIFVPELHGREHLSVHAWLENLRAGNKELTLAFDNGFVSLAVPGLPDVLSEFRAEFYFTSDEEKPFLTSAIKDSVSIFYEIFGRVPQAFVPSNGLFHPDFDKIIVNYGVKYLYVSHSMPYPVGGGKLRYRHFITGSKGPGGIVYYTRNCAFEPTAENYSGIDLTIRQIEAAFRWGKPASISTHRVNFVGGISSRNREKGLTELRHLLSAIVRKWPDAAFMSTGEALNYMKSSN